MAHVIEPAVSGRAKCRGCGRAIAKGEPRLGERIPNPFADEGETTLWFHLICGAYKRPEVLLEALEGEVPAIEDADLLVAAAKAGLEKRRLPRIDGAERAPSGRASCRSCREKIAKGEWRIRLVFYEEGMFNPSGTIHAACAEEYLGTKDLMERLRHFTPDLETDELEALAQAL